jgi:hypothetical protein
MSSLLSPLPPPPPVGRRCHRRNDSFLLIQAILKENERLEQEEHEKMLEEAQLIQFSTPKCEKEGILEIPRKSRSHHSVRFATEPPKVFRYENLVVDNEMERV